MARKRRFAKGRKSRGICERTGFEVPYRKIVVEPGTKLLVENTMSDGRWNRVDHPQNYSPRNLGDGQRLKNATGDENFEFANCDFVYTRLYDHTGQPLLTAVGGDQIFNTFTKLAFNSFKKV